MYELQADPNLSRPSSPSDIAQPPAFSPPTYAVWVNSLWSLSLVISLTCAMLATSLQQWARRYLRVTQPERCSPQKRARVRALFADGVGKFRVDLVVETLPALVHLSLSIFFAGLVIYLFNINPTVFSTAMCWVALLSAGYGFITLMPMFWLDSPYYSPLSSLLSSLFYGLLSLVFRLSRIFIRPLGDQILWRYSTLTTNFLYWLAKDVAGKAEETVRKRSTEIDGRIMVWTIDALWEDDSLEEIFEAVPGFYKSDVVEDLRWHLPSRGQWKIKIALIGFLARTLSSNSISAPVKIRRLTICFNAADEINPDDGVWDLLNIIMIHDWHGAPHSVEIGHFLRSWVKASLKRSKFTCEMKVIIACIIASVREHDDGWIALAMDHLGVPEGVLRDYLSHGDSVLLANLIHLTRYYIRSGSSSSIDLERIARFDIRNTLPELQHEFCTLWNEIVEGPQMDGSYRHIRLVDTLKVIRHLYIALHKDTDAAPTAFSDSTPSLDDILDTFSSYPPCHISGHLVRELSSGEFAHSPATAFVAVPHRDSIQATATPFSPVSYPDDATPHLAGEPSLVVEPSHLAPRASVPPPNNAIPFDSAATTSSTQANVNYPTIPLSASSDPHPTQKTRPHLTFTHSSSDTTDPINLSPSIASGMSSSFTFTYPRSRYTFIENSNPFPTPTSQSKQRPPSEGLSPPDSGTAIPLIARQRFSIFDPTTGVLDDSQSTNDPTPAEVSGYPPQPAHSVPDIAKECFSRSRDSLSPSHDLGGSQKS